MEISKINKDDAEELGWAVVEALAEAADMSEAGKLIMTIFGGGKAMEKELSDGMVKNPYWHTLGFSSGYSKKTRNYLNARARKNFAASLFKWGGSAASWS